MNYNEIGNTGMRVSALSFGASSLGGVFHGVKETDAICAVHTALEAGMNFIDVSPYYGHLRAETVLGKALRGVSRDTYFLSTKVGRYGHDGINTWDYSAERAAILGALEPITALLVGTLVFGERLTPRIVFGIVLVLAAVTLLIAGKKIYYKLRSYLK